MRRTHHAATRVVREGRREEEREGEERRREERRGEQPAACRCLWTRGRQEGSATQPGVGARRMQYHAKYNIRRAVDNGRHAKYNMQTANSNWRANRAACNKTALRRQHLECTTHLALCSLHQAACTREHHAACARDRRAEPTIRFASSRFDIRSSVVSCFALASSAMRRLRSFSILRFASFLASSRKAACANEPDPGSSSQSNLRAQSQRQCGRFQFRRQPCGFERSPTSCISFSRCAATSSFHQLRNRSFSLSSCTARCALCSFCGEKERRKLHKRRASHRSTDCSTTPNVRNAALSIGPPGERSAPRARGYRGYVTE